MKIYFKKGFYFNGYLYGWHKKKLFRLPKVTKKGYLPLLELKPCKEVNGYNVGRCKKSIKQLEAITTDINYIYEKIMHDDCPF
jgi:hypothetical protein